MSKLAILKRKVSERLMTASHLDHAPHDYHLWYYNRKLWEQTSFLGVETQKSPLDMWNYQEILSELQPSLVIEFGSFRGGSALYFACMLNQLVPRWHVLSVDIDHSRLAPRATSNLGIEFLTLSSSDSQ